MSRRRTASRARTPAATAGTPVVPTEVKVARALYVLSVAPAVITLFWLVKVMLFEAAATPDRLLTTYYHKMWSREPLFADIDAMFAPPTAAVIYAIGPLFVVLMLLGAWALEPIALDAHEQRHPWVAWLGSLASHGVLWITPSVWRIAQAPLFVTLDAACAYLTYKPLPVRPYPVVPSVDVLSMRACLLGLIMYDIMVQQNLSLWQ